MKHRNRAQSSSLFLLELILAILFFSLASAVCVQFFVKSHLLSRDARNLNYAVNECSGIAEIVNASGKAGDALDLIRQLYEDAESDEDGAHIHIYYDGAFTPCARADGVYSLTAELAEEDDTLAAEISMKEISPGKSIYQLAVKHHLQRRAYYE